MPDHEQPLNYQMKTLLTFLLVTSFICASPVYAAGGVSLQSLSRQIESLKRTNSLLEQRLKKLESMLVLTSSGVRIKKLIVEADLTVGNNVVAEKNLIVGNNLTVSKNLLVQNDITGHKNLNIENNIIGNNNLALKGSVLGILNVKKL